MHERRKAGLAKRITVEGRERGKRGSEKEEKKGRNGKKREEGRTICRPR